MFNLETVLGLLAILVGIFLLEQEHSNAPATITPIPESHTEQYTVYLDPDFTPEQVLQAESAMAEWESNIHNLHFDIVRKSVICNALNCPHSIAIHPDTHRHITEVLNRQGQRGDFLGATYMVGREGSNVYVATDLEPDQQKYVFMHELGHSLGEEHDNEHPSIMCQVKWCMSQTITAWDIAEYARLHK